jgi:hypothetical protein
MAIAMTVVAATAGGAARPVSAMTPPPCSPLPLQRLGTYTRSTDHFTLLLGNCTFEVRRQGTFETGGDYTVTSGNAARGEIVLSNDRGCGNPDEALEPTPYAYVFDGDSLQLSVVEGVVDGCVGRKADLTHAPFAKLIKGKTTISYDRSTSGNGHFKAIGAIADAGALLFTRTRKTGAVVHTSFTLKGAKGSIVVAETVGTRRTWRIASGTRSYRGLEGGGTETRRRVGGRTRVVMSGSASNV